MVDPLPAYPGTPQFYMQESDNTVSQFSPHKQYGHPKSKKENKPRNTEPCTL